MTNEESINNAARTQNPIDAESPTASSTTLSADSRLTVNETIINIDTSDKVSNQPSFKQAEVAIAALGVSMAILGATSLYAFSEGIKNEAQDSGDAARFAPLGADSGFVVLTAAEAVFMYQLTRIMQATGQAIPAFEQFQNKIRVAVPVIIAGALAADTAAVGFGKGADVPGNAIPFGLALFSMAIATMSAFTLRSTRNHISHAVSAMGMILGLSLSVLAVAVTAGIVKPALAEALPYIMLSGFMAVSAVVTNNIFSLASNSTAGRLARVAGVFTTGVLVPGAIAANAVLSPAFGKMALALAGTGFATMGVTITSDVLARTREEAKGNYMPISPIP